MFKVRSELLQVNYMELRCKSSTEVNKLAGSIYSSYTSDPQGSLCIRAVGAGAVNQAIKAVVVSNKFFGKLGLVAGVEPHFLEMDGITIIVLRLAIRNI